MGSRKKRSIFEKKDKEETFQIKELLDDISLEKALKIEKLKVKIACGNYYIPEGEVARKMLKSYGLFSVLI